MKVVVVNDCSHVIEDMLPFLKLSVSVRFLPRSRGFLDKTLLQACRIAWSTGDVFHVNYGLQDAWLTRVLKHLDVLWLHGSDVRGALVSRKWGWMVRGNIKKARRVLVATADLLPLVSRLRLDVDLLPRPVRTDLFKVKRMVHSPIRAVYFPKSYDCLPEDLPKLLKDRGVEFTVVDGQAWIPYVEMPKFLANFDIFVDQTTIPELSKTCLEAMSCGLSRFAFEHKASQKDRIEELSDPLFLREQVLRNREFVLQHHSAEEVARRLLEIWKGAKEES